MQNTTDAHDLNTHDLEQLTTTLTSVADHLTVAATSPQTSTTPGGALAAAAPSDGVREGQAVRAAGAILAATDRLMAAVVGLLGDTSHRGVIAAEGVTLATWLRVFAGRTVGDEKMLTATVERLADMPAVSAWFTDGTISWPTVRGIVAATRSLTGDQRRWLDATFAADRQRVCRLDADQIVAAADRLAGQARPDLHADRAQRQYRGQRFAVHPRLDGTSHVSGEFDAEATATLLAGLDTDARADSDGDHDDNPTGSDGDHGDTADDGGDGDGGWRVRRARSNAARLIAIVAGHLAGRYSGRARPSMLVVTDAATLARDDAADTNRGNRGNGGRGAAGGGRVTPDGGSSTAQLLWNTHRPPVELTATAVQRLACDAAIRHILTDSDGAVLGATAAHPAVSASLRAALVARDGGCRFPGCVAPVDQCDTHHVVPVSRSGATTLANLALVCSSHHHAIHDSGWATTLHADATITFTRRGVTISSQPRTAQHITSSNPPPAGRPRRRQPAAHAGARPSSTPQQPPHDSHTGGPPPHDSRSGGPPPHDSSAEEQRPDPVLLPF